MKRGRVTGAVKFQTTQDCNLEAKLARLETGNFHDPEAWQAACDLYRAIFLNREILSDRKKNGYTKASIDDPEFVKSAQEAHRRAWNFLIEGYPDSVRRIFSALVAMSKPSNCVRLGIGHIVRLSQEKGLGIPSIRQFKEWFHDGGTSVSGDTIRRALRYFNVKPSSDKRGDCRYYNGRFDGPLTLLSRRARALNEK